MGYTFISYSTKDQAAADAMRALLLQSGIPVWMAPNDIPAGSRYASVINQAIRGCDSFLLLLSRSSQTSVWVSKEVERAVNYRKRVISARLDDVPLNDEFELYISTDQMVRVDRIEAGTPEINKLLQALRTANAGSSAARQPVTAQIGPGLVPVSKGMGSRWIWIVAAVLFLAAAVLLLLWRPWKGSDSAPETTAAVQTGQDPESRQTQNTETGAAATAAPILSDPEQTVDATTAPSEETAAMTTAAPTSSTPEETAADLLEPVVFPLYRISAGGAHTVGLQADGTAVAVGTDAWEACNVSHWKDLVSVAAGGGHTLGLKANGRVLAAGEPFERQCDVHEWSDIVSIDAGYQHSVGLRSDGTVVATGFNYSHECDVETWRQIIAVAAGAQHTVGLCRDGTVVAVGDHVWGQCGVDAWKRIVAIDAGSAHTVGLQSDGTVVAVGRNEEGQCGVSEWRDIVAIAAGYHHTVGLRSDGTVVAVGENEYGQCDVSGWVDIVAISAGASHTVGLRSDGTVVAAGSVEYGKCNVSGWNLN